MGNSTKYWASTMFRGVAAMLAGTGVFFLPHLIPSSFRAPVVVSLAMLCLAAFAVIDAAILSRTAWTIAESRRQLLAFRTQSIGAILLGASLFWMVYSQRQLRWFLAAAALQALLAAGSSLAISAHTTAPKSLSCRLSFLAELACAAALLLGALLIRNGGSWLIDTYLCCFGLNLMLLSITMLSAENTPSRLTSSFTLDTAALR
jgi:hypothetical protein